MRIRSTVALVGAATLLVACATTPTGPAVTVMPGNGKTFEAFQQDAAQCQEYAQASLGGPNASGLISYAVNGKQYIVGTGEGCLYAFALPD